MSLLGWTEDLFLFTASFPQLTELSPRCAMFVPGIGDNSNNCDAKKNERIGRGWKGRLKRDAPATSKGPEEKHRSSLNVGFRDRAKIPAVKAHCRVIAHQEVVPVWHFVSKMLEERRIKRLGVWGSGILKRKI